ncbi:FAD binding domain-containing protein [Niveomyces insectorum RCEF 264]|uniref:FAD binding domain-containing protein n=1 Tax=Niveomyces insectorum RCEF 264 TaxID=1081102 RepID=A0A167UVD9_9HYPO|nr:FAD binding domain-containing protein [Niveomyces insectorum RCEF 264]
MMATPSGSDIDVLIVGAGPTGLMLAIELAAHNRRSRGHGYDHARPITFRIVDQNAHRATTSRAVVVQSRPLELLARHGLADRLMARGTPVAGVDVHVYRRHTAAIELDDIDRADTAFPRPLLVSQADTEALLEEHLRDLGYVVERRVRVGDIVDDGDGVKATARCAYVVGCDGAHSRVRHAAAIAFAGGAYPQRFLLCDAPVADWPTRPPGRLQLYVGRGFLFVLPFAERVGVVRFVAAAGAQAPQQQQQQPRQEEEQQHQPSNDGEPTPPTLAAFQHLVTDAVGEAPRLHDPLWLAAFHLHHRCAAAYRAGRLFLAGDAAHIHSPAGGQGMNTGIGDAVNLGWKLAASLRRSGGGGGVADGLLDSYDAERRPVGERLLQTTDRMFSGATADSPLSVWLRNAVLRWVLPVMVWFRAPRAANMGWLSQLRIRYRRSAVVGTADGWAGPVRGGDRAPDGRVAVCSDEDGGAPGETAVWLLAHVWTTCGPTAHHLLLFTGSAWATEADGVVITRQLAAAAVAAEAAAATGATAERPDDVGVHVLASSAAQATACRDLINADILVDTDGCLHARYGFGTRAGYVLVRPDGHVAHIGGLEALPELFTWLQTRR